MLLNGEWYNTKLRRMRETILGWAVFVWSIYLVEFKLICYGKQQVGDCLIIIDGNERCFMGNYIRFFFCCCGFLRKCFYTFNLSEFIVALFGLWLR